MSFSSCIREYYDVREENDDYIQLELFTRFYDYNIPVTRDGKANENDIKNELFVIVFAEESDSYKFTEAAQAYYVSATSKTYVILKKQTAACKLLILANTQDDFYISTTADYKFNAENLTTVLNGKTLEQACNLLQTTPLADPPMDVSVVPFTPNERIPMSYVYETTRIDHNTTIGTETSQLPLGRVAAKIIVKNKATNFTLSAVNSVINAPRQGYLHNLSSSLTTTTNLVNYTNGSDIASATGNSTEDNPIYLYESAVENKTYLIIKGIYQSKTYYYKMAIVDNNKDYIDLFRNHSYIFTITQVDGKGHDTVAEAIAAPAFNDTFAMTLTVTDTSTYETVASDQYYLSVSNSLYIGHVDVGNNIELTVCTLVAKNEGTGTVNGTIDIPNAQDSWITLTSPSTFTVSSALSSQIKIKLSPSTFNKGTIRIRLGNIEKNIGIIKSSPILSDGTYLYYYYYNYNLGGGFGWYEYEYYLLSGYLEDSSNKSWLQLSPASPKLPTLSDGHNYDMLPGTPITGNEDKVMVDDGLIQIHVLENTSNNVKKGTVYLTRILNPGYDPGGEQTSFRIKLDITQYGNQ